MLPSAPLPHAREDSKPGALQRGDGKATSIVLALTPIADAITLSRFRERGTACPLPCPRVTNPPMSDSKNDRLKARLARGFADRGSRRTRRHAPDGRDHPRGLRALGLRGSGNAVHRIHRRARQIPARPGPAERGRVLVPGRRRAMAVAALRPDGPPRPLCGRELGPHPEAVPQLPVRPGVPQREAGSGTVPAVPAVRRRHGGCAERRWPMPRCA